MIPQDQWNEVMNQDMCDIEPEFLGFVDTYYYLSKIIPLHFTVIDFGCAYNPQCFFFEKHNKLISVDIGKFKKFNNSKNNTIVEEGIDDFINERHKDFDMDETFAICSYVGTNEIKTVKSMFKNVYTFYPSNKEEQKKLIMEMRTLR